MPYKILVADDEQEWIELLRDRFCEEVRRGEWEIIAAYNGREALERVKENPDIAVILLDIRMPEMDGMHFLEEFKKLDNPMVKVIGVTAYGQMTNIRAFMNQGAFDFLVKPVDFKDLKITIDKAIRQSALLQEALRKHDEYVKLERELEIASRIQESMVPQKFPPFPGQKEFDIFAKMLPAKKVGGDFYDFFYIDHDRVAFILGDVQGKGIPAALYMAKCCTMLKTTAIRVGHPGECLERVNNRLIQENDIYPDIFVTVLYGVLNFRTGILKYSCGGHHPPYILRANGKVLELPDKGGIPLGMGAFGDIAIDYEVEKIQLSKGDAVIGNTDGVIEAENPKGEFFNDDKQRLERFLASTKRSSVEEIVNGLFEKIDSFTEGHSQSDDITVLALRNN